MGNPSGPLAIIWGLLWLPPGCPGAWKTTPRVAAGRPRGRQGSPKGARRHPKQPQGGPIRAQRVPKQRPRAALGTPGEALGQLGVSGLKRKEGDRVLRLKNGAGFGAPEPTISTKIANNFRIEFCCLFDALLAAKLAPKAGQREAKGSQKRGQSIPWRPLSLPFSSFGRVRRTPRKCWQGQYKRKVGRPRVGHGNALRQAKQGQGRPRQAK